MTADTVLWDGIRLTPQFAVFLSWVCRSRIVSHFTLPPCSFDPFACTKVCLQAEALLFPSLLFGDDKHRLTGTFFGCLLSSCPVQVP